MENKLPLQAEISTLQNIFKSNENKVISKLSVLWCNVSFCKYF